MGFRLFCLIALLFAPAQAFVPAQRALVSRHVIPERVFLPAPLAETNDPSSEKSKLPFFLDPNTKGGAVFLSLVLFIAPIVVYNVLISMGYDEIQTGQTIGIGFTIIATLAWVSTYLFRVVTKDMTYAKQLKDYENAVIAKRLEELDEDELQALVEEVEKDEF